MFRSLVLGSALLAATQAAALSCIRPDPAQSFRMAQESPDRYVVLYGSLSADPALFPPSDGSFTQPLPAILDPAPVPATFTGHSLTREGFTRDASGPLLLQPTCAGPWCGGPPGPGLLLVFARLTEAGQVIEIDPCGTWVFPDPSLAMLELMAACLRGEACGD